MIKRFILWLIRVVASIAVLVGIFLIICGALGLGNTLIPGIIVLVIALIVNSSTLKKAKKRQQKTVKNVKNAAVLWSEQHISTIHVLKLKRNWVVIMYRFP